MLGRTKLVNLSAADGGSESGDDNRHYRARNS